MFGGGTFLSVLSAAGKRTTRTMKTFARRLFLPPKWLRSENSGHSKVEREEQGDGAAKRQRLAQQRCEASRHYRAADSQFKGHFTDNLFVAVWNVCDRLVSGGREQRPLGTAKETDIIFD